MLKVVHNIMKFFETHDVFIVNYMIAIKIYQGNLYSHYIDLNITFKFDVFFSFKSLVWCNHDNLFMCLLTNPNLGLDHLDFEANGQHVWA
jgi:hypothetical protein